jgi:hypothetical protein
MPSLHKGARILAWFAIVYGALSVATPWAMAVITGTYPEIRATLIDTVFGFVCLVSGVFGLRRQQWAFWAPMLVFLSQVVEFGNGELVYALGGPLAIKHGWYWQDSSGFFAFNILAIVMVGLFGHAALRILEEDKAALRKHQRAAENA